MSPGRCFWHVQGRLRARFWVYNSCLAGEGFAILPKEMVEVDDTCSPDLGKWMKTKRTDLKSAHVQDLTAIILYTHLKNWTLREEWNFISFQNQSISKMSLGQSFTISLILHYKSTIKNGTTEKEGNARCVLSDLVQRLRPWRWWHVCIVSNGWCKLKVRYGDGFKISWHTDSRGAENLPADGLLLISDACLPECAVRLLQTESDSPLQVIFVIPSQVNHICIKKMHHKSRCTDVRYNITDVLKPIQLRYILMYFSGWCLRTCDLLD